MKKLLLVLVPAVLLLTSCLGDSDSSDPPPQEYYFTNTFIVINNQGRALIGITEEFVDMYRKNGEIAVEGVSVNHGGDGSITITVDFDVLTSKTDKYPDFKDYQGKISIAVTGLEPNNIEGIEKVIDLGNLKFNDYTYGIHSYGGLIRVLGNPEGIEPNAEIYDVSYENFSLTSNNTSEKVWSISYSYQHKHTADQDIFMYGNGTGTHSAFKSFRVYLDKHIVKKKDLRYISEGAYQFFAESIGVDSFEAEYGKAGDGSIVITCVDKTVHVYQQALL